MKITILLASFWMITSSFGQEYYFSNQPFVPGKEKENEIKTEFKDSENVYGLVVYEKTFSDLDLETDDYCVREDGSAYNMTYFSMESQSGLMKGSYESAVAIEENGKTYVFLYLFPDPSEAYYFSEIPHGIKSLYKPENFGKKLAFRFGTDIAPRKFVGKIKIAKGTRSEDAMDELQTKCTESATWLQDRERGKAASDQMEFTYAGVKAKVTSDHIFPGCMLPIEVSLSKDGSTYGEYERLGRHLKAFDIEIDGGYMKGEFIWSDDWPFGKNLNESVNITITNKYNKECVATLSIPFNYVGNQAISVGGDDGQEGADGRNGNKSAGSDGSAGGTGVSAGHVDVYLDVYKPGYIIAKVVAGRYEAIMLMSESQGGIHVDNSGGNGGAGGDGGDGANQQKGNGDPGPWPGANGANGGNGGDGGSITFHLTPAAKSFQDRISYSVSGGAGGFGGNSGLGGGFTNSGDHATSGNRGNSGYPGADGPTPKFVTESFTIDQGM